MQGYLETLMEVYGRDVLYVSSDADDPLFTAHHPRMEMLYLNLTVRSIIPRLDSDICVFTVPDLGQLHIGRPKPESCALYLFHSLGSIHEMYLKGAFDNYDAFFCAGPHHRTELVRWFELIGRPLPALFDVGYYKLDRIMSTYAGWTKRNIEKTVLIAPSWGAGNLLEAHGVEITSALLALGVQVIVRPHPCFFLPIYPRGREVVAAIEKAHGSHENLMIERNIHTEDSFYEADLMISDWSGASFEYALGTLRPVLFMDVARKTRNPDYQKLGLDTFEDVQRSSCGMILASDQISELGTKVRELLDQPVVWQERLKAVRARGIYNPGNASEVGAAVIAGMLDGEIEIPRLVANRTL
jgi:YidC/Oxa1 family membrane protein insertase